MAKRALRAAAAVIAAVVATLLVAGTAGAATPVTFTFVTTANASIGYHNGGVDLTVTSATTPPPYGASATILLDNVSRDIATTAAPALTVTNYAAGTPRMELVPEIGTDSLANDATGYPDPALCTAPTNGICWSLGTNPNSYSATWPQVQTYIHGLGGLKTAYVVADASQTVPYTADVTSLSWNTVTLLPAYVNNPCKTYERVGACNTAIAALTANGVKADVHANWNPSLSLRKPGVVYNVKPYSTAFGAKVLAGSGFPMRDGPVVHAGSASAIHTTAKLVPLNSCPNCYYQTASDPRFNQYNGWYVTSDTLDQPYYMEGSRSTFFVADHCTIVGGNQWCYLEDSNQHYMNARVCYSNNFPCTTDSDYVANYTPEQWLRLGAGSCIVFENRHYGTNGYMGVDTGGDSGDLNHNGYQFCWTQHYGA